MKKQRLQITAMIMNALAVVFLSLASGCVSSSARVPSVSFQGIVFNNCEADSATQRLKMDATFQFLVKNPLDARIPLPEHQFELLLDGIACPSLSGHVPKTNVTANGSLPLDYKLHFDLGSAEFNQLLGRIAHFTFKAKADLNPFPSSAYFMEFTHDGSIKLPQLPEITPIPSQPATLQLLGQSESIEINLNPIYDGMKPFVDAMSGGGRVIQAAINTIGGNKWDAFKTQWNDFGNMDKDFKIPTSTPKGI